MKSLLLTASMMLSISCFSQFYIGYRSSEVIRLARQSGANIKVETDFDDDHNQILGWDNKYVRETVFFKNGISWMYTIYPTTKLALNGLIKQFNERYLIVSNEQWKAYTNGKVYNILLVYTESTASYAFGITQTSN